MGSELRTRTLERAWRATGGGDDMLKERINESIETKDMFFEVGSLSETMAVRFVHFIDFVCLFVCALSPVSFGKSASPNAKNDSTRFSQHA
jgi:hypothetical protein